MVEGAIAHYQATGQRNFLDIAIRMQTVSAGRLVTNRDSRYVCQVIRLQKWHWLNYIW